MRCPAATARWFTNAPSNLDGSPIRWFTINVQYFVDPGPLSNSVSHDAAEAMVAAAAQVWNVPSASLTLQKGGLLNEDVSSSNVYLGSNGPIWPSDVQAVNYKAKNIAIVFDADGTLTDMLLGRDASDPLNCRQNAVTEIVDGFSSPTLYLPAFIAHAMVFLNGRCTGPTQEQQLQMQYQLMRTFGRIIGVGWSQTNDNVFTGATQPTYLQQTHWPIMHPIDILCGPYTYQCLPDPFSLRDDDVAAVALVYPIGSGQTTGLAGKEETLAHAAAIRGNVTFPNGMGMTGVNMVMTRQPQYLPKEEFADTSAVSGYPMQGEVGNPVTGVPVPTVTQGSSTRSRAGSYLLNRMPLEDQYSWENFFVMMEPINPLYQGAYSVGPYHAAVVSPSGPLLTQAIYVHQRLATGTLNFTAGTQAADCTSGDNGSESAPMQIDASGTWVGRLCGYGHTAWMTMATNAGRTMTIEVTAQDETSMATQQKALPLVGLWNASDAVGILPTITWTPSALNGQLNGMTQLKSITTRTEQLRIAVAEQRGEGRPDFGYRTRVLYADSVIPSRMDINGGRFRIFGSGFEIGNAVTVGGVLATVEEWSPSQIVAVAPSFAAIGKGIVNDVAVTDLKTGGQTKIIGGMVYGSVTGDAMTLVSAPTGTVMVGSQAAQMFGVRLVSAHGKPVVSASVVVTGTVAGTPGGVLFGCGAITCTLTTDGTGLAQTTVISKQSGSVMLTAVEQGVPSVTSQFFAVSGTQSVSAMRAKQYVAADESVTWDAKVTVLQNGIPSIGQTVIWNSPELGVAQTSTSTDTTGVATGNLRGTLAAGVQVTVTGCAWGNVCASLQAQGVSATEWKVNIVSGAVQSVNFSDTLSPLILRITDAADNPVAGVLVSVLQTAEGWQPICSGSGRCAVPPIYGKSSTTAVSDGDGLIVVTPLAFANTAEVTKIVAAAGPNGHISLSLEKRP